MMRRWLIRILLCLILGVVTTVAVAWGTAYCLDKFAEYQQADEVTSAGTELWHELRWDDWPVAPNFDQVLDGGFTSVHINGVQIGSSYLGASRTLVIVPTDFGPQIVAFSVQRSRSGLPFDSLVRDETGVRLGSADGLVQTTIRLVASGVLINTLFYGVIWFGIFFGFGSARRTIRKSRGRCPKCAYQLRGQFDAGCSECGWNRPEVEA